MTMPAEIIGNIVKFFNYDQTFFNFRLTCKAAEAKSRYQFAKRFFTEAYMMWAKWSLHEVNRIAAVLDLARNIATINLDISNVSQVPDDRWWKGTQAQRAQYDIFMEEEEFSRASYRRYGYLFSALIQTLPSLRVLNLERLACREDTHYGSAPAVQRLMARTSVRFPEHTAGCCPDKANQAETKDKILHTIMRNLYRGGSSPITTLSFGCPTINDGRPEEFRCMDMPCCTVPPKSGLWTSPVFEKAYKNITVFRAHLCLGAPVSEARAVAACISKMKKLTTLRLSVVRPLSQHHRALETLLKELTKVRKPHALKIVDLWGHGDINPRVLEQYLRHISGTLEELSLSGMHLKDGGGWFIGLFYDLLIVNKSALPKLDILRLVEVLETAFEGHEQSGLHPVLLKGKKLRSDTCLEIALEPCPHYPECDEYCDPFTDSVSEFLTDSDTDGDSNGSEELGEE